jgi:sec-independent protein translocase protein TatC
VTEELRAPILTHLGELRNRVIKAAVALVVAVVVAFLLRNQIFDLLVAPWEKAADDRDLVFFRPTEAFTFFMRLSLFGGVILASPFIIWQAWAFVSPGLHRREKRYIVPIVSVMVVLFIAGLLIGYWSLERGLGFLLDFGQDRLEPVVGSEEYLSFAMRFLLVFGIAFLFPVFLFSAALVGVVGSRTLRRGRRWAVLLIVTLGAVITPSGDPLTLLLLSTPLYLLYEITILLVRFVLKR